jgi:hypothetical protein
LRASLICNGVIAYLYDNVATLSTRLDESMEASVS